MRVGQILMSRVACFRSSPGRPEGTVRAAVAAGLSKVKKSQIPFWLKKSKAERAGPTDPPWLDPVSYEAPWVPCGAAGSTRLAGCGLHVLPDCELTPGSKHVKEWLLPNASGKGCSSCMQDRATLHLHIQAMQEVILYLFSTGLITTTLVSKVTVRTSC